MKQTTAVIILALGLISSVGQVTLNNASFVGSFSGGGGAAPPSYVGVMYAAAPANGNAADVVTLTAGSAIGDRVLVVVSAEPGGATPGMGAASVSDSEGNTYALAAQSANSGQYFGSAVLESVTTAALTTSSTVTVNWTNATFTAKTLLVFNTRANSGVVDCRAVAAMATSTTFVNACATANASGVAIAVFGMANTGTWTWDGFTAIADQNNGDGKILHTGYRVLSEVGTINGGGTAGTSGAGHGELVVFKNQ